MSDWRCSDVGGYGGRERLGSTDPVWVCVCALPVVLHTGVHIQEQPWVSE